MILEKIAENTRRRVSERKAKVPLAQIRTLAEQRHRPDIPGFWECLEKPGISFICEVKKASPSKGLIDPEFPYLNIAREYEQAGAAAVSVLTEPDFFQGSLEYLKEISGTLNIPVLRKDFVVDEYQIYEAAYAGAKAVLLICELLDEMQLKDFIRLAQELGMDVLAEGHTQSQVNKALDAGAKIIGVNNRDLKTFEVHMETSLRLRKMVPDDRLFVSESGIRTAEDIARLRAARVDAVLIGETLMLSPDKAKEIRRLRGNEEKI